MKVTVTSPIKNLEGKAITDAQGVELTFRTLFYAALNNFKQDEVPTVETKAKCYALMQKLFKSKEVKITVDEAALLKERVGKLFSPLEYGRVCDLLDGNDDEAANDDKSGVEPAKQ